MAGRDDGGGAASGARMLAPEVAGERLWPGAIASRFGLPERAFEATRRRQRRD